AQKTQIPEPTLFSLEKGLILTPNIKEEWCHQLAITFNEDIAIFETILDRELPHSAPFSHYLRLYQKWAIRFFASKSNFYFVFGVMWLTLAGWLFNAGLNNSIASSSNQFMGLFVQPIGHLKIVQVATAVSILLICLWITILDGESIYSWIQKRRHSILPLAIACLLLLISNQYLYGITRHFQCQIGVSSLNCQSEFATAKLISLLVVFIFSLGLTVILFKFGRQALRFLHRLQTQRKLVYLSLILTFLMPFLFFKSTHAEPLMSLSTQAETGLIGQHMKSLDMPIYQQISPAESKMIFKKIWYSEPASQLRTQIEAQNPTSPFAIFQFAVTVLLYGLIGIAVCRKGKFISAFTRP
ncbi:MAG: hypothetical protein AAF490_20295, partial [Chloroflexota bacterium]